MKTYKIVDARGVVLAEAYSLNIIEFILNDLFTENDIKENGLKIISEV